MAAHGLPPFDAQGNLPPAVYRISWEELTRDFRSRGIVEVIVDDPDLTAV